MQKPAALLAVVLLATLQSNRVAAQNAFLDAKSLDSASKDPSNGITFDSGIIHVADSAAHFISVLKRYVPGGEKVSDSMLILYYHGNPFLRVDTPIIVHRNFAAFPQQLLSPVSNLDVTSFANGVSALLVERAKQELTIAFFNHFQAFVKKEPAFGILFPTTTANLSKLLSYAYPQMLPILRSGFLSDLRALPMDMAGLLDIPEYASLFQKYPELTVAIRSLKAIGQLQSGASTPVDVFDDFANFPELQHPGGSIVVKNIAATVRLGDLFSQSLRSSKPGQIWMSPADVKPLLTDPVLSTLYLGLLWQGAKTNPIFFYSHPTDSVSFCTLLGQQKPTLVPFLDRVNAFIVLGNQPATGLKTITENNRSGKTNTNADLYNYIGTTIDAIDTAFGIVDLFVPNLNAKPYLHLVRTGNSIYKDIYSQQYTQAISDGIDLIDSIGTLAGVAATAPGAPDSAAAAVKPNAKAKQVAKTASKQPSDAIQDLAAFAEKVKPYVVFMGNLLEATSSADVQAALDNAILPVGSSSIKKNTRNNLAIQAYLGAYAVVGPGNKNATGVWSDRWGVTAPIGFAYTPGFLSGGNLGSLSLFLEVFDLGAIVDYQLKTDSVTGSNGTPTTAVSKSYSVQLGQILSPGLYLVYGAPANLPLALSFGGQYGPGLSKINTSGQTTVANPSWRWNFTLTVDLPLFNLWNVTQTAPRK